MCFRVCILLFTRLIHTKKTLQNPKGIHLEYLLFYVFGKLDRILIFHYVLCFFLQIHQGLFEFTTHNSFDFLKRWNYKLSIQSQNKRFVFFGHHYPSYSLQISNILPCIQNPQLRDPTICKQIVFIINLRVYRSQFTINVLQNHNKIMIINCVCICVHIQRHV